MGEKNADHEMERRVAEAPQMRRRDFFVTAYVFFDPGCVRQSSESAKMGVIQWCIVSPVPQTADAGFCCVRAGSL